MKLTWFGGTTLRAYIGGAIIVIDADDAPAGIDRGELLAGADRVVRLAGDPAVPVIDPGTWRPRTAPRAIEDLPPVEVLAIGPAALLIAAAGEPALVILGPGMPSQFGRWADGSVVLTQSSLVADATALLDTARPRLIALAAAEGTLDLAVATLAGRLDGAGLVSLERGLALEV